MSAQHDAHVKTHGTAKTVEMAQEMIGTAAIFGPETIAENEGFRFDAEAFDLEAFICARCDWCCSMDEANETSGGELVCDDCAADEDQ